MPLKSCHQLTMLLRAKAACMLTCTSQMVKKMLRSMMPIMMMAHTDSRSRYVTSFRSGMALCSMQARQRSSACMIGKVTVPATAAIIKLYMVLMLQALQLRVWSAKALCTKSQSSNKVLTIMARMVTGCWLMVRNGKHMQPEACTGVNPPLRCVKARVISVCYS